MEKLLVVPPFVSPLRQKMCRKVVSVRECLGVKTWADYGSCLHLDGLLIFFWLAATERNWECIRSCSEQLKYNIPFLNSLVIQ